jgi:hypothetical protein
MLRELHHLAEYAGRFRFSSWVETGIGAQDQINSLPSQGVLLTRPHARIQRNMELRQMAGKSALNHTPKTFIFILGILIQKTHSSIFFSLVFQQPSRIRFDFVVLDADSIHHRQC